MNSTKHPEGLEGKHVGIGGKQGVDMGEEGKEPVPTEEQTTEQAAIKFVKDLREELAERKREQEWTYGPWGKNR